MKIGTIDLRRIDFYIAPSVRALLVRSKLSALLAASVVRQGFMDGSPFTWGEEGRQPGKTSLRGKNRNSAQEKGQKNWPEHYHSIHIFTVCKMVYHTTLGEVRALWSFYFNNIPNSERKLCVCRVSGELNVVSWNPNKYHRKLRKFLINIAITLQLARGILLHSYEMNEWGSNDEDWFRFLLYTAYMLDYSLSAPLHPSLTLDIWNLTIQYNTIQSYTINFICLDI